MWCRENMQFLFEVAIKKPTRFRMLHADPPEPCLLTQNRLDTMTAQPAHVHVQCHQSIQPSFNFCLVIINSSFLMTFSSQPPAKANRWRTYVILGPYFMIILWDAFILYWVQTSGLDLDWLSSFLGLSPFSLDRALWDALYVMKIIYIEDTKFGEYITMLCFLE